MREKGGGHAWEIKRIEKVQELINLPLVVVVLGPIPSRSVRRLAQKYKPRFPGHTDSERYVVVGVGVVSHPVLVKLDAASPEVWLVFVLLLRQRKESDPTKLQTT